MLCFTAEACPPSLTTEQHSHQYPPSISFCWDLPCLSVGAKKIQWPRAKPGALPHQQHLAPRPLASLASVSQCNAGENDTGREAGGAEPLLASGLLSALTVIWKQSQPLQQGKTGSSLFSSLYWASHGFQNMYTHLSTNLLQASTCCLEQSCRFLYTGKLSLL